VTQVHPGTPAAETGTASLDDIPLQVFPEQAWPQGGHPAGILPGAPQLPFIAGTMPPPAPRTFWRRVSDFRRHRLAKARAVLLLGPHVGVTQARTALVGGSRPWLQIEGTLRIGTDVRIGGAMARCGLSCDRGATLTLGDHVWFHNGVRIHAARSITIGNRVMIGEGTAIYDTTFHAAKPGNSAKVAPIVIEDDVWIAREVLIGPGVRIGRGSVVGSGTVLNKSVPPGSIVVGSPGRIVDSFEVPENFRRV
jgi:acetyltransferase-like isoleucine patch superfamily enzyme